MLRLQGRVPTTRQLGVSPPREFLRLQGFEDDFVFEGPKTHLYNQAANSVAVPVIREIAKCMKKALEHHELKAKQLVAQ